MVGGAYILHLVCETEVQLQIGALGTWELAAGHYVYVGSAKGGIEQRVKRHQRLAENKSGKMHWHIDRLLVHPAVRLVRAEPLPGKDECAILQSLARRLFVSVPVPGFGSSDCKAGCRAHLLRLWQKPQLRTSKVPRRRISFDEAPTIA